MATGLWIDPNEQAFIQAWKLQQAQAQKGAQLANYQNAVQLGTVTTATGVGGVNAVWTSYQGLTPQQIVYQQKTGFAKSVDVPRQVSPNGLVLKIEGLLEAIKQCKLA